MPLNASSEALDPPRARVRGSLRHKSPIDQHDAVAETFRVPGTEGTAVAERVVILATQEVKTKVPNGMMAAAPSKGKSKTEHAGRKGYEAGAASGGRRLGERGGLRRSLGGPGYSARFTL